MEKLSSSKFSAFDKYTFEGLALITGGNSDDTKGGSGQMGQGCMSWESDSIEYGDKGQVKCITYCGLKAIKCEE